MQTIPELYVKSKFVNIAGIRTPAPKSMAGWRIVPILPLFEVIYRSLLIQFGQQPVRPRLVLNVPVKCLTDMVFGIRQMSYIPANQSV
jgi:hypothetical protein